MSKPERKYTQREMDDVRNDLRIANDALVIKQDGLIDMRHQRDAARAAADGMKEQLKKAWDHAAVLQWQLNQVRVVVYRAFQDDNNKSANSLMFDEFKA